MGQKYADFLFNKSREAIDAAHHLYKTLDDDFIYPICYPTQQAIEKLLKYTLDVLGINYNETHNIGELIDLINMKLPFLYTHIK